MRKLAVVALAFAVACGADSIFNVDTGDAGGKFELQVGQRVDVKLWNCLPGYDQPTVSSDAVEYLGGELDGIPSPGCHSEKHHFVGRHSGSVDVVFRRVFRYDSAGVRQEQVMNTLAYRFDVQ